MEKRHRRATGKGRHVGDGLRGVPLTNPHALAGGGIRLVVHVHGVNGEHGGHVERAVARIEGGRVEANVGRRIIRVRSRAGLRVGGVENPHDV